MRKVEKTTLFLVFFCFEGISFILLNLKFCLDRCTPFDIKAFVILLFQTISLGILAWGIKKLDSQKVKDFVVVDGEGIFRPFISAILFFLSVIFWTILLLFTKQVYFIYYQSSELSRLVLHFFFFLIIFVFELFVFLPILYRDQENKFNLSGLSRLFTFIQKPTKVTIFILVLIVVPTLTVLFTGAGINPDNITIIDLGVPLLESQIWYGAGLIILMIWMDFGYRARWFFSPASNSIEKKKWESLIFLGLWAITFFVWNSQDIPIFNNFVIGNVPPNYEILPYSDAKTYDKSAIVMMLGDGKGIVYTRVLYVFFLSLAHSIAGFDYTKIITFQTIFLSLIPPVLYLVGKEIHSNGVGIIVGLFAMLRETNSILAGNLTTVSISKLLLSDVPTLLIVSIIAFVLVKWVKGMYSIPLYSILLGGWLGVGILLRTQVGFLVPAILITCLVIFWRRWDQLIKKLLWIALGLLLVLGPILIRNYQLVGSFGLDEPGYLALNFRRFDLTGEFFNPDLALSEGNLYKELALFIITHPGRVLGFTYSHFLRNALSTFFIFPVRLEQITSWKDLFYITTPFWKEVNLDNGVVNSVLIVLNLFFLVIGISKSQNKQWWPTFTLACLYVFYTIGSSIGRFSGWRFVLPVDWIGYTFLVIGLTEILMILSNWILGRTVMTPGKKSEESTHKSKWIYFQLVVVLFFGWGNVIQEQVILQNDKAPEQEEICSISLKSLENYSDDTHSTDRFFDYCMNENTIIKQGIGVYPEYFKKNTGYSDASEKRDLEATKDFSRFFFVLFDNGQSQVYVRTDKAIPYFLNGGEVIAMGKKSKYGFEADAIFFGENYQEVLLADDFIQGNSQEQNQ